MHKQNDTLNLLVRFGNSTRGLALSKILASVMAFAWLMFLSNWLSQTAFGDTLKALFISQTVMFLSDQGLTASLVLQQSSGALLHADLARTLEALKVRARRIPASGIFCLVLCCLFTDLSLLGLAALLVSHVATSLYSTTYAGLLGANERHVEAFSEVWSRGSVLLIGSLLAFKFPTGGSTTNALWIFAFADLLSGAVVLARARFLFRHSSIGVITKLKIDKRYRTRSTIAMGVSSTVGLSDNWAMAGLSSSSDFGIFALTSRLLDAAGLIASHFGYANLNALGQALRGPSTNGLWSAIRKILLLSLGPTFATLGLLIFVNASSVVVLPDEIIRYSGALSVAILSIPFLLIFRYLSLAIQVVRPTASSILMLSTGALGAACVTLGYLAGGLRLTFVTLGVSYILKGTISILISFRIVRTS